MSDLFYYIGILPTLDVIANLTIWRKSELEELLSGFTLGNIINSVKKLRVVIAALLYWIWVLIGSFYAETNELTWLFRIHIGYVLISGFLPLLTKNKKKKIITSDITNIIGILFAIYIILRHFNLLQW